MKKGWEIKRLPEIAEYFIGLTYSPKDVSDAGTIVLRSSNVQNDELDLSDLVRVTCSVKKPLHVRKGDILMCSRNGSKRLVGKTAVIGNLLEEMTFGTFMTVIRSELNSYLSWFFRSEAFRDQIGVGENTMINQITKYMLDVIRVPVPPRAEQQRIVGLLDEAFAGLATAKANAEKNLQNARALFESHLQSVFTQRGPGWVEKKLEEIGKTQTGSTPKTSNQSNYGDFISFVKPGDFNRNGTLDYDKDGLSESGAEGARKVPAGSVLMVCIGATIGKCGYCDQDVTTNQQVNALTPSDGSSNRFIYYQMLTETFQRKVIHASGQATLPIINKSKWSALSVWLPPKVTEQKKIAAKFDALVEETQRLARLYSRKLAALEALKKSLLHRAFSGQL